MIDDRGAHHLMEPAHQIPRRAPFAHGAHRLGEDVVQQVFSDLRVVHLAPDRRQQATAKLAVGRGQGLLRRTLLHRNLPALDRHAQQLAVARVGADDSMGAQQVLAAPTTLGAPHTAWLRSAALHWVRAPCVTTRDEPAVSVTTSDT